jgi:ABC-2 type transport system permease protein
MLSLRPKPKKPEQEVNAANSVNPTDLGFTAARGSNGRNIRLIIGREYKARVRRRAFVISSVVMVVLVIVASFVPTMIQYFSSNSRTKVAVINNAGQVAGQDLVTYLNATLNLSVNGNGVSAPTQNGDYEVRKSPPNEADTLRKQVKDGELDGLLIVSRQASGELSYDYYSKGSVDGLSTARIRQALTVLSINDRLARSGLPQNQVATVFNPPDIKATSASQEKAGGKTDEEQAASYLLSFFLVVVLFMTIYGYGVAVAQGAAEEKSNRVMEIMVSAATPFQLMMGKIIGIGLAGFTQVSIIATTGVLAFLAQNPIKEALLGNKTGGIQVDVTKISLTALLFFLIFYVLGFTLFASLYAAVGSLVSRQEDVQVALTPLSIINTAGYMVAVFGLQAIDATWVTVLSYVPFFTPFLMFGRLALGAASWWEGLIAVGVLLVSTVILTWLSSRVYRAGVLLYGRKLSTGQILKLMWAR